MGAPTAPDELLSRLEEYAALGIDTAILMPDHDDPRGYAERAVALLPRMREL